MRRPTPPYLLSSFLAISLFSLAAHARAGSDSWKKLEFVNGCRIMDWEGNTLQMLPGRLCAFFDDGRFVTSTERELSLYDHQQKKLWSISGHFHHQITLSADRKSILTLSSTFEKRGEETLRFDRLLRIGLDGKILNEQSAEGLFSDPKFVASGIQPARVPYDWEAQQDPRASYELGHFNSIYEIPKQTLPKKDRLFEEGQIVVNSLYVGIFVLTPDFKKVVYFTQLKDSLSHSIHDVQVLPDGTFLYFNNKNSDPTRLHSSIDIYDPRKSKRVFKYAPVPEEFFYSAACGSVQLLDADTLLFSDLNKGVFIVDRKSRKLIRAIPQLSMVRMRPSAPLLPGIAQQIKALDLRSFRDHWR